ncbi:MAG: formylglycine-generating enzyme family protein [Gammaproteobacteria bacterium]|nr:formylglycine-generating enzyme family protein [Gammaproteobacteria bacterium]
MSRESQCRYVEQVAKTRLPFQPGVIVESVTRDYCRCDQGSVADKPSQCTVRVTARFKLDPFLEEQRSGLYRSLKALESDVEREMSQRQSGVSGTTSPELEAIARRVQVVRGDVSRFYDENRTDLAVYTSSYLNKVLVLEDEFRKLKQDLSLGVSPPPERPRAASSHSVGKPEPLTVTATAAEVRQSAAPPPGENRTVLRRGPGIVDPLSIDRRMVKIPGGCFLMGSAPSEPGRDEDERYQQVCIGAFELSQYEVTLGEFSRFVSETGHRTDAEANRDGRTFGCFSEDSGTGWRYVKDRDWRNPGFIQDNSHPVVCISWMDAIAYIDWINEKTGLGYRLPTEAEWEFAAKEGNKTERPWGSDSSQACSFSNVSDTSAGGKFSSLSTHPCDDLNIHTSPIGSYSSNKYGLFDLIGNVSEWTCSNYSNKYNGNETRCARVTSRGLRVHRGGSWNSVPDWTRSSVRVRLWPAGRADTVGFRLAQSLDQVEKP